VVSNGKRVRTVLSPTKKGNELTNWFSGDDDYFSADLENDKVRRYWARFEKPVLVLHSGEDEFVPKSIDQVALNKRYQDASPMVSRLSGLIPGTGHAVEDDAAREWLAARTAEFLETLQ
jgi:pimeloyl-ACP methyl ester carboxylesterase